MSSRHVLKQWRTYHGIAFDREGDDMLGNDHNRKSMFFITNFAIIGLTLPTPTQQ